MIVLGISGFEDAVREVGRHPYAGQGTRVAALSFDADRVPLQYFPLGLIGHDAAAAIVVNGRLVATAAEERFTRYKHGFNLAGRTLLPRRAIQYCLDEARCDWSQVDVVAHYCRFTREGVVARLRRVGAGLPPRLYGILEAEYGAAFCDRLAPTIVREELERIADRPIAPERFDSVPHHLAHAAGAFYSSDVPDALCVTLDGYGEEESALWARGVEGRLEPLGSILLPTSLGALYQIVTTFLGFRTFGDEYKTMGLAAYGDPDRFADVFAEMLSEEADGTWSTAALCRPDLGAWLEDRLGPIERPGTRSARSADVAAALQAATERAVLRLLRCLRERYGATNLCLGGGVALNACLNGRIVQSGMFDRVFVQPAAADDGAALGAALYAHARRDPRGGLEPIGHAFWGPMYSDTQIEDALRQASDVAWGRVPSIEARTAKLLADGGIVGWYQGRMEAGPRALGARSILATPTSAVVRDRINALVKGREPFRPFAPSVTAEDAHRYFHIPDDTAAPFMVVTYPVRERFRSRLEGVVHVDGSARVQVVRQAQAPRYHRLLCEFAALTGLPVLLNTSFNRAGEPIVCTPADAVQCFLRSGLDALVMGDYLIRRRNGAPELR